MKKNSPTFLNSKNISIEKIPSKSFVIIGVPYDKGTSGRLGSSLGPSAIRQASLQYSWPKWNGFYEPRLDKKVLANTKIFDVGNIENIDSEEVSAQSLTNVVKKVNHAKSIPILLGGDHSITYYAVKAFDQNIQVIQFDAHGDYQRLDETDASPSGTVMRKINGLPTVKRLVQIGIRGFLNSGQGILDSKNSGNIIIPWGKLKSKEIDSLLASIDKKIPVYITFDTDFFDPSICPGTTVPEPDGPSYRQSLEIITKIVLRHNVIGFDVVELCPQYDNSQVSALHVTKLILDLMSLVKEKSSLI